MIAPLKARRVQTGTVSDQYRPVAPQGRQGVFAARREVEEAFMNRQHKEAIRNAWTSGTCLAFAAVPWLGPAPALIGTLQTSILQAERLNWGPAAPLMVSAAITSLACFSLGKARGDSLVIAFAKYLLRAIFMSSKSFD